ncbi:MAG: c-type cytochrome domain-containing protein [Gemmataceae bacterium]
MLTSFETLMMGGDSGKVVVKGEPNRSLLYTMTAHLEKPYMPPNRPKLRKPELTKLRKWIEGGLLPSSKSVAKAPPTLKKNGPKDVTRPTRTPPIPTNWSAVVVKEAARKPAITSLAASPTAPVIAVPGNKQLLVYHATTLKLLGVLPFPEGDVFALRFSRDGTLLLAAGGESGQSGKVVIWDIVTGKRKHVIGDELDAVLAADISPDHKRVAFGGPGRVVKIYSTKDGRLLHTIRKHTDWIYSVAFSPEGLLLATSDRNGSLFVWEAESAKEFWTLRGHTGPVHDLAWRADSNVLSSAGEDGTIRLWDMHEGKEIARWKAHVGGVLDVRFGSDEMLASGGRDKMVRVWDQKGKELRNYADLSDHATAVALSSSTKRVLGGDWSGTTLAWSLTTGKILGQLKPRTLRVAKTPTNVRVPALAQLEAKYQTLRNQMKQANARAKNLRAHHVELTKAYKMAREGVDAAKQALTRAEETANRIRALENIVKPAAEKATIAAEATRRQTEEAKARLELFRQAISLDKKQLLANLALANEALANAKTLATKKQQVWQASQQNAETIRRLAEQMPNNTRLQQAARQARQLSKLLQTEAETSRTQVEERTRDVSRLETVFQIWQRHFSTSRKPNTTKTTTPPRDTR